MIKILLILFVSTVSATTEIRFNIGGTEVTFARIDNFLVNSACEKNCEAYKQALKFKSQKISSQDRQGGKNPASVKCTKYLAGEVVFGQDREGNQQSFCLFPDKSYLLNQ